MKSDFDLRKEILLLEKEAEILARLRKIRNELLSNGAYHDRNLENQTKQLRDVNASEDEINLIARSNDLSCHISHLLMKKYNRLLDYLEKVYKE